MLAHLETIIAEDPRNPSRQNRLLIVIAGPAGRSDVGRGSAGLMG
jgi:hypothetical protein